MPDYEYTDISYKDFETALNVFLNRWVTEQKKGKFNLFKDWNKLSDEYFAEIMDAVDQQGISPEIMKAISPNAAQIFGQVFNTRVKYEWEKQQGIATADWQRDTIKAATQYAADTLRFETDMAKWGQDEAWRRYNAAWQEHDREWQKWEKDNELARTQLQLAQHKDFIRGQGLLQKRQAGFEPTGGVTDRERAGRWEANRNEIIAGLDKDFDWIKIAELGGQKNPYVDDEKEMRPAQRERKWAAERETLKDDMKLAKELEDRAKDPNISLTFQDKQFIDTVRDEYANANERLIEAKYAARPEWAARRGDENLGYEQGRPAGRGYAAQERARVKALPDTPGTPDWLGNLYPELGERLPKRGGLSQLAPIGGQAWGGLSPSEQQGLLGYAKYTGADPQDWLWQSQQILPKQPQIASRWSAARQRA